MPLEEISCLLKKFLVTGRKFSCHRNNFLSQEAISCHINIFLVTRKFSCNGKKLFTRNILALDKVNIFSCKQYVLPVRGFVPPFAISIHLLCTNSIFRSESSSRSRKNNWSIKWQKVWNQNKSCERVLYGCVWSHMVLYGPLWSCLVLYGSYGWAWSMVLMVMYGHIYGCLWS